jgi:hypothetical protein
MQQQYFDAKNIYFFISTAILLEKITRVTHAFVNVMRLLICQISEPCHHDKN